MTREEAIEQIYTRISKEIAYKEQFYSVIEALERLKEPITLAEFLNKEEGVEYEWRGDILMLENGKIYYKSDKCSSGWCNYAIFGNEIDDLRQAKKVEPKYYAKIKGWEVFEGDGYYWNYSENARCFFIGSKFRTERTKSQWAELGIDEDNADFERVEDCKSCE